MAVNTRVGWSAPSRPARTETPRWVLPVLRQRVRRPEARGQGRRPLPPAPTPTKRADKPASCRSQRARPGKSAGVIASRILQWREAYVGGRGRIDAHRRQTRPSEQGAPFPIIVADHCFLNLGGMEREHRAKETATAFVFYDTSANICVASVAGLEAFSVRVGFKFLDELGYARMVMTTDGEPSIAS